MNSANKVKRLTQCACFTAILAVLAQLSIPFPGGVPISMQTFGVVLIGFCIGPIYGLISVLVYILLGAVGIPVFATLQGGMSVLVGKTGGFIIGFIPFVILVGIGAVLQRKIIASNIKYSKIWGFIFSISLGIVGLFSCYFCGAYWIMKIMGINSISTGFKIISPFIIKDVLSVIFAIALGYDITIRLENNGIKLNDKAQ